MSTRDRYDSEDWSYMLDPDFWKMIEERRAEPTIPWEQVKKELIGDAEEPLDETQQKEE